LAKFQNYLFCLSQLKIGIRLLISSTFFSMIYVLVTIYNSTQKYTKPMIEPQPEQHPFFEPILLNKRK